MFETPFLEGRRIGFLFRTYLESENNRREHAMDKNKLRPFIQNFKATSPDPLPKAPHEKIDDDSVWNQYNNAID